METTTEPPESIAQIRVVIVEDHGVLAESLGAALAAQPDLTVVGTATTPSEAIRVVCDTRPDVVLMDYGLEQGDGLLAARGIKGVVPETRVVIMTGVRDETVITGALDAGCDGFVRKTAPLRQLIDAIRTAAAGGQAFAAEDLTVALRRMRSAPSTLTKREFEVLRLMAAGASTADMVRALYLSPHTVRSHVRHILEKLGAHSKLEAVAIAARDGLINVGGPEEP
ncbi:MAG: response regulator transcription factor [Acidimicrobiales bacterium]|nr:response regulator transcription factor [Acidimicrobiales bacterium]